MAGVRRSAVIALATVFAAGSMISQAFCFVPATSGRGMIRSHNERKITNLQYRTPQREVCEARQLTMKKKRRGGGKPSVQQLIDEHHTNAGPIAAEPTKIMVAKLQESWTEDDVKEFCTEAGPVKNVKLIKRQNAKNKARGYAFVEYEDEETASRAIRQLKFSAFKGERVEVNPAYEDASEFLAAFRKWESENPEKVAKSKEELRLMSMPTL